MSSIGSNTISSLDVCLSTIVSSSDGSSILVNTRGSGHVYGAPVLQVEGENIDEAFSKVKKEYPLLKKDGKTYFTNKGATLLLRCAFANKAGCVSCEVRGRIRKTDDQQYTLVLSKNHEHHHLSEKSTR